MATIASLVVDIGADTSKLISGADRSAAALGRIGSASTALGQKLSIGVSLPVGVAGAAILKMGADAVESESLFETSFGAMAEQARSWSEETASAMGRSEFALRQNAATLFTMGENMGLSRDNAFAMSTGVAALAQDLESFFNLRPGEGFEKLRAGLVGSSEPLQQLGILTNVASIEQTAYARAILETGRQLTEAEKVQARWIAIQEQTTVAQGDVIRTADGAANQWRAMQAALSDAGKTLGIELQPVLLDVIQIVRDLVPLIQAGVRWFSELSPAMKTTVAGGVALVAALGPLLTIVGGVLTAVSGLAGWLTGSAGLAAAFTAVKVAGAALVALLGTVSAPIWIVIGAVTAAGVAFWKWRDDIVQIYTDMFNAGREFLVDKLGGVFARVGELTAQVTGFFRTMYQAVVGGSIVPDMVTGVAAHIATMDQTMVAKVGEQTGRTIEHFARLEDAALAAEVTIGASMHTIVADAAAAAAAVGAVTQIGDLAAKGKTGATFTGSMEDAWRTILFLLGSSRSRVGPGDPHNLLALRQRRQTNRSRGFSRGQAARDEVDRIIAEEIERRGGGGPTVSVTVTGNTFVGSDPRSAEALSDLIEAALRRRMPLLRVGLA